MKFNSTLIVDGKTMDVIVEANSISEAKILTKQKYKNSRVVGVLKIHEEVK